MKLFLCPNGYTGEQARQAIHCVSVLEQNGHACALFPGESDSLYGDGSHAAFPPAESDLIVSLGGDGAVLRAAQTAISCEKPLIGINSGRLGFLCAMEYAPLAGFSENLSRCVPSRRSLLCLQGCGGVRYALNDVVVAKQNFGSTVDLGIWIDDKHAFHLRGDGVILATPTGSTGYSYSAGGPILDSDAGAILLTPICPHSVGCSVTVLNDHRRIRVSERDAAANVYADGVLVGPISSSIDIRKAEKSLCLYTPACRSGKEGLF